MIKTVLVIVGISVAAVVGLFALGWCSDRNRVQKGDAAADRDGGSSSVSRQ